MSHFISAVSYTAQQSLAKQGFSQRRSHLSEIIASLLGYRTLAACQAERKDKARFQLEDAEFVVLNKSMGLIRASVLPLTGLGSTEILIAECVSALRSSFPSSVDVFLGVPDFFDSHARERLAEEIYNSEGTAMSMADCNACFSEYPDMDIEALATRDLWSTVDEWTIQAKGKMTGEYDPEGDRMHNGHVFLCFGELTYQKAGRAGLIYQDFEGGAGPDQSLMQLDHEAEQDYYASICEHQPDS